MKRRTAAEAIVVTGLGTVNALAHSVDAFAAALRAGTCAIGPVTGFDATGYRSRIAAEVKDLAAPTGCLAAPAARLALGPLRARRRRRKRSPTAVSTSRAAPGASASCSAPRPAA